MLIFGYLKLENQSISVSWSRKYAVGIFVNTFKKGVSEDLTEADEGKIGDEYIIEDIDECQIAMQKHHKGYPVKEIYIGSGWCRMNK